MKQDLETLVRRWQKAKRAYGRDGTPPSRHDRRSARLAREADRAHQAVVKAVRELR